VSLLKTASPAALQQSGNRKSESSSQILSETSSLKLKKIKDLLWQSAWKAICDVATFDEFFFDEFPLKFLQMLTEYYTSEVNYDAESVFNVDGVGSLALRSFLETVVLLARPRRRQKPVSKSAELQIMRCSLTLLKLVYPNSVQVFNYLISTLAEISFSALPCVIKCPFRKVDIILDPIPSALRVDVGRYLAAVINFDGNPVGSIDIPDSNIVAVQSTVMYTADDSYDSLKLVCLDIISRRFVMDICDPAITHRTSISDTKAYPAAIDSARPHLQSKQGSLKFVTGLLLSVGSILSMSHDDTEDEDFASLEVIGKPMHRFDVLLKQNSESVGDMTWSVFHSSPQDLEVLLNAMRAVLAQRSEHNGIPMKPLVWSSLVVCVLCVCSPWSSAEINTPVSLSEDESLKVFEYLRDIVSLLSGYAVAENLPSKAVAVLVDSCISVSRLIIDKLELLPTVTHVKAQMAALLAIFEALLKVTQSISILLSTRQKAMSGALAVVANIVDSIFKSQSVSTRECMRRGCEKFLLELSSTKCRIDVLPYDKLDMSWAACCSQAASLAVEEWSIPSSSPANRKGSTETTAIIPNKHVFILHPIALRILKSESSEGVVDAGLRNAAHTLLSSIDFGALMSFMKTLDSRLSKLEVDQDLRTELSYMQV
jgi:hypothetical protein